MIVTDDQVAALRAQLKGDSEKHRRLLNQLDPEAANVGYVSLVGGAFFEAARRRFLKDGIPADDAEIIDFVTSVRMWIDDQGDKLDPNASEIMIKIAIEKLPPEARSGISGDDGFRLQSFLLAGLISDAGLSPAELESFLATARSNAEEMHS
ncbi:hypothetical protein [Spirillospora sp. NPDC048823]|uniref:hypothetical protein n=1 Tax=unclassified Spirillospora TaxID=2642701 RepID=UPI00371984CB